MRAQLRLWHNRVILGAAQFALNGNLAELRRLEEETAQFCRERSLSAEVAFDLNLALEELFTNAVRHGGCDGMDDAVRIRLELAGDRVLVEFSDRGRAFDPASVPAPDFQLLREGRSAIGLGIHLVRQIMSDVCYQRAGEWNRTTMRRPV